MTVRRDRPSWPSVVMCRCTGCFDCPTCGHHLSTRSVGVAPAMAPAVAPAGPSPPSRGEAAVGAASPPDVAASTPPRKAYYLACAFCRWTSRDVGIVDAATCKTIKTTHDYFKILNRLFSCFRYRHTGGCAIESVMLILQPVEIGLRKKDHIQKRWVNTTFSKVRIAAHY